TTPGDLRGNPRRCPRNPVEEPKDLLVLPAARDLDPKLARWSSQSFAVAVNLAWLAIVNFDSGEGRLI
ncbi:unnamed protein product, partial [Musa banksii]